MIGDRLSMNPPMSNFVFTNNIVNAGSLRSSPLGTDGSLNCAVHDSPIISLNNCFTDIFSNNAVVAIPSRAPVWTWKTCSFSPTSATAVEFVDCNKPGEAANTSCRWTTPFKGAGTDSKDLRAGVRGVNAAIARVR